MRLLKKIGQAILITIGLIALAFILITPFVLISNVAIKMGLIIFYLFAVVLGALLVDEED